MDWAKTTARGDKKHLSFVIWCDLYQMFYRRCGANALYSRLIAVMTSIKSPRFGLTMFAILFHRRVRILNFRYLRQRKFRSWETFPMTSPWPWAVALIGKNVLVCTITWDAYRITTSLVALYWPYLRNSLSVWRETKKKVIDWILGSRCDLNLWYKAPTMTTYFSRPSLKMFLLHDLLARFLWNESNWYDTRQNILPYPLTTHVAVALNFKGTVWNSLRNGNAD